MVFIHSNRIRLSCNNAGSEIRSEYARYHSNTKFGMLYHILTHFLSLQQLMNPFVLVA